MATANFYTMENFDLYAIDLEMPDQYWDFLDILDALNLDKLNLEMRFHKIHTLPGYYSGDQIFVETLDNFREFDDDESDYFFGIPRDEMLEQYEREIREIREWMAETLPPLGFQKLAIFARFDNGETIYTAA